MCSSAKLTPIQFPPSAYFPFLPGENGSCVVLLPLTPHDASEQGGLQKTLYTLAKSLPADTHCMSERKRERESKERERESERRTRQ